jgi:hypothetical protein
MCKSCDNLKNAGYDIPSKPPEHSEVMLAGDIPVFKVSAQILLAYLDGSFILTVEDPIAQPGLHDDVLYTKKLKSV